MKGKSGWIRILEATIAVLLVSGTMLAIYSEQSVREDVTVSDYSYSLQKEILADIVDNPNLRLNALAVVEDHPGDLNYDRLVETVEARVPDSFGYSLRVCDLGDLVDFCKMDANTFIATLDNDIFVEEVVISSELGTGNEAVYSPKKVRLFFWEGGFPADFCRPECTESTLGCSADGRQVLQMECGDFDGDGCLEYSDGSPSETCPSNSLCSGGTCLSSSYSQVTCSKKEITESGCVSNFDNECNDHDGGERVGSCWFWEDKYECWDYVYDTTECSSNPVCDSGFDAPIVSPCVATGCTETCTSTGHTCGTWDFCGIPTYCGPSCTGGAGTFSNLTAYFTMGSIELTFDSSAGCYYNKCNYEVEVVSDRGDFGTLWKRVYNNGEEIEYNLLIVVGEPFIDSEAFGNSNCLSDVSYTVNVYDSDGVNIGDTSFICDMPNFGSQP